MPKRDKDSESEIRAAAPVLTKPVRWFMTAESRAAVDAAIEVCLKTTATAWLKRRYDVKNVCTSTQTDDYKKKIYIYIKKEKTKVKAPHYSDS